MKFAICIGNGLSREKYDLNLIKNLGVTWGCNYLTETFVADNVVAADRQIAVDLLSKNLQEKTAIWTQERWTTSLNEPKLHSLSIQMPTIKHRWDNASQWGSGTSAVWTAAQHGADVVILLGYDIWPTDKGNSVDPNCWIYQLKRCFKFWHQTSFVQIQPTDWTEPADWLGIDNLTKDTYVNLVKLVNSTLVARKG